MGKPTEAQLEQALARARQMRERDQDPDFLGKSLLHCHYEHGLLQAVMHATEIYLHSGMAEHEHRELLRALEKARSAMNRAAGKEPGTLGL
jgi:hypothetical protein